MGSNPAGDIFFPLHPPRSEQVSGAHVNEIKHDHSPVVIVVLDPDTINHIRPYIFIAACIGCVVLPVCVIGHGFLEFYIIELRKKNMR